MRILPSLPSLPSLSALPFFAVRPLNAVSALPGAPNAGLHVLTAASLQPLPEIYVCPTQPAQPSAVAPPLPRTFSEARRVRLGDWAVDIAPGTDLNIRVRFDDNLEDPSQAAPTAAKAACSVAPLHGQRNTEPVGVKATLLGAVLGFMRQMYDLVVSLFTPAAQGEAAAGGSAPDEAAASAGAAVAAPAGGVAAATMPGGAVPSPQAIFDSVVTSLRKPDARLQYSGLLAAAAGCASAYAGASGLTVAGLSGLVGGMALTAAALLSSATPPALPPLMSGALPADGAEGTQTASLAVREPAYVAAQLAQARLRVASISFDFDHPVGLRRDGPDVTHVSAQLDGFDVDAQGRVTPKGLVSVSDYMTISLQPLSQLLQTWLPNFYDLTVPRLRTLVQDLAQGDVLVP